MNLRTQLVNYLTGHSSITDVVPAIRWFLDSIPQETVLPSVVVEQVSDVPDHYQGGSTKMAEARVRLTIVSDDPSESASIEDLIRKKLDGYRGTIGAGATQITVLKAQKENATDGFIPPLSGKVEGIHPITVDYSIWHRETAPDVP